VSALDRYLAGVDEAARPTVRALDAAIRDAGAPFDVAVKYRMLMYTLDARWRPWVVAVGTSSTAVQLRFLWGVLMADPLSVLRAGSSTLMTWDLPYGADVDASATTVYVREALAHRDTYLADGERITAAARTHRP
jgi:hypothetical protein